MKEAIGSDKFSEYTSLTPEERQKRDEEWAKSIKKTRPKDYRDDWFKILVDYVIYRHPSEYRFMQIPKMGSQANFPSWLKCSNKNRVFSQSVLILTFQEFQQSFHLNTLIAYWFGLWMLVFKKIYSLHAVCIMRNRHKKQNC